MRSSYANVVDLAPYPVPNMDLLYCLNFISRLLDLKCLCRHPQPLLARLHPCPFFVQYGKKRSGQAPLALPTSYETQPQLHNPVTGKPEAVGPR